MLREVSCLCHYNLPSGSAGSSLGAGYPVQLMGDPLSVLIDDAVYLLDQRPTILRTDD